MSFIPSGWASNCLIFTHNIYDESDTPSPRKLSTENQNQGSVWLFFFFNLEKNHREEAYLYIWKIWELGCFLLPSKKPQVWKKNTVWKIIGFVLLIQTMMSYSEEKHPCAAFIFAHRLRSMKATQMGSLRNRIMQAFACMHLLICQVNKCHK